MQTKSHAAIIIIFFSSDSSRGLQFSGTCGNAKVGDPPTTSSVYLHRCSYRIYVQLSFRPYQRWQESLFLEDTAPRRYSSRAGLITGGGLQDIYHEGDCNTHKSFENCMSLGNSGGEVGDRHGARRSGWCSVGRYSENYPTTILGMCIEKLGFNNAYTIMHF